MHYLYGIKRDGPPRLVATFTSEQQLLAYVRWATLESYAPQHGKFEQGGAGQLQFMGIVRRPHTAEDPSGVVHNPTPSML